MNATTTRGRPRSFCDETALDQALTLFWQRGYPGTSYTDLCAVTGLNKPSLYAAFGNKESMFLAALDRYRCRHVLPALAALEAEPDAREAVRGLLQSTVGRFTHGPGGCMIATNAACTQAPDMPPDVAQALAATGLETRAALAARLARAQAEGQLAAATDIPALIGFIETVVTGLAGRAKMGATEAELAETAEIAMRAWPR